MVFQGTVFGPDLWNMFFEDAKEAIAEMHYDEGVFANDSNAYRIFPGTGRWKGRAANTIGNGDAHGEDFKMLGVQSTS